MGVFADIVIGNRRGVAEKWPNTLSDGTLPNPRLWLPDEDKMYGRKQNEEVTFWKGVKVKDQRQ